MRTRIKNFRKTLKDKLERRKVIDGFKTPNPAPPKGYQAFRVALATEGLDYVPRYRSHYLRSS